MPTCDLCGQQGISINNRYTNSDFKQAVRSGLRPPPYSNSWAMGRAYGLSVEEQTSGWVQRVMADTTDWVLCEKCAQHAKGYFQSATGGCSGLLLIAFLLGVTVLWLGLR